MRRRISFDITQMKNQFIATFIVLSLFSCSSNNKNEQNKQAVTPSKVDNNISVSPQNNTHTTAIKGALNDKVVAGLKNYHRIFGAAYTDSGSIEEDSNQGRYVIVLFKRQIQPDGKKAYLLSDTINFKYTSKDDYFSFTYGLSRYMGKEDFEIICLAANDTVPDEYNKRILKAWRINTTSGTINRIDTLANIDCPSNTLSQGEINARD